MSCASSDFCAVTGSGATAYIYSGGSWNSSQLVGADGNPANLTAVSCPAAGECFAAGNWDAYQFPNGRWSNGTLIQDQATFTAVSCSSMHSCAATDSSGNVYVYASFCVAGDQDGNIYSYS